MLLALNGCSTVQGAKNFFFGVPAAPGATVLSGFIGGVAADEPNAALVARDVLSHGGNAADAATALAFTLTATYPSRAGLGGGGACLIYKPGKDGTPAPEALVFPPPAPAGPPQGPRPAAVPLSARGLFALSARYGSMPIEQLIAPAERFARTGASVSRAFATDLAAVGGALMADPQARAVFARQDGTPLQAGDQMLQPDLGVSLAEIRVGGVGELYQGSLGRRLVQGSTQAGGPIPEEALRRAVPRLMNPLVVSAGDDLIGFTPSPADGGIAAAAAFDALASNMQDAQGALERSIATVAALRTQGGSPEALLRTPPARGTLPALPASTGFVVLDRGGMAVTCTMTMNNLFGTGRIAPGTGILLAASPAAVPPPLLAPAIAYNSNIKAFRAAVAGTGQAAAGLATAVALSNALHSSTAMPAPVPDPGRANVVACSAYLPSASGSCAWATDPRGAGLAIGGAE